MDLELGYGEVQENGKNGKKKKIVTILVSLDS